MQGLDDLYREVILDHYRSPHGAAAIENAAVKVEGFNPLCGDELVMELSVDSDGRIDGLHIEPNGCSISVASASMLAQQLTGKSLDDAIALKETFKSVMRGESWPEGQDFGDLEALEGVKNFPVRIKCALLAWMTLEQALAQYDPELANQVEADDDIEVKTH
ncbi:MAG: SUF system NifU family Fe-S cluster assembly protein [Acidobacteria bacterium]|nr:SUF system NifU family Fe-S cluster assembly protein [Acidobacteriota bacterium]